jgi:predicted AlkP superfamily pyrophosphatase or phosphodiesterase
MKIPFRLLLCWLAAFSAGCATQPSSPPASPTARIDPPAPLLLISIDGYRHDYLERGLSPTLAMLARTGVRAASMQPAFPSLTFPNHYSIVTGLIPDHHGVVNNMMTDPVLGDFSMGNRKAVSDGRWWAQGTPIWETADQHGLRTATMFWPGTEADIHGHHPDYWEPFDVKEAADKRVDQVLTWLDLPLDRRPTFITLYFDAVDHAGHEFGPDSPQENDAQRTTDAALARLVRGLEQRRLFDRMNIIVVSDHGMAPVPPPNNVIVDRLIPLDQVTTVATGVLASFNPKDASATAQSEFAAIEHQLEQPQQHMQCWDKTRVPARLRYGHNPRVPQLLCLADIGWHITTTAKLAEKKPNLGEHGYDNAEPQMQATFVARGPDFRVGATVGAFPNVDVYPLMAHLLGIPAMANDGSYDAVKDMLKPASR